MKTKGHVCNYAVVHFLPYPETGEFACVGILLLCQDNNYLNYKIATKRRDRISAFFPEMEPKVFTKGRLAFEQHLKQILSAAHEQLPFQEKKLTSIFKELTRPRESLFRFSSVGTVLTDNPASELEQLYGYYVERQFAQKEDHREGVMRRRLQAMFRKNAIAGYKEEKIGNDDYNFNLPFVFGEQTKMENLRAIKPLCFAHNNTTHLIDHGELWYRRTVRLKDMGIIPNNLLFSVEAISNSKHPRLVEGIHNDFRSLGAQVIDIEQHEAIIAFAKPA